MPRDKRADPELIAKVLAGDQSAFAALMRRYKRLAGSVAYGFLGDFHSAADVVQDSFVKAYQHLDTLDKPDRFRSWLMGIVRRTAIDALRKRDAKRESSLSTTEGDIDLPDENPGPAAPLEAEDRQRQLARALEKLPESQRTALALKYLEGLSYKEIAARLETTESAVESRLVRARQALAEILKRKM